MTAFTARYSVAARDDHLRITSVRVYPTAEERLADARTRPSDPDDAWLEEFARTKGYELEPERRRQRVTDETVQEIIRRYGDGFTVPTIARALNLSADTVKRYLRHAGVQLRDDRQGQWATRAADRIAAAGATTRQIRVWARENGYPVPLAGQVPDLIITAYLQAHDQSDTPTTDRSTTRDD